VVADSLVGQRFGCWLVLRDPLGPAAGQRRRVWCRCACGEHASVAVANLTRLPNIRCKVRGCLERQDAARASEPLRARRESA
jgi:hypothetical protein